MEDNVVENKVVTKSAGVLDDQAIDLLKKRFGQVFVIALGNTDYYYRQIKDSEFKEGLTWYRENIPNGATEVDFDEWLVGRCLLWPLPNPEEGGWVARAGGIVPTLAKAIQDSSYFVVPGFTNPGKYRSVPISDSPEVLSPTSEQEAAAKAKVQNKNLKVFKVTVGRCTFIGRSLTWSEVLKFTRGVSSADSLEMDVARIATLWPEDITFLENEPAGTVRTYFDVIDEASENPFAMLAGTRQVATPEAREL